VEIAEVALAIQTFGRRYLERVFTGGEILYCLSAGRDAPAHFAARFAAKEAVLKAIRVGDEAVDWRSIEVEHDVDGAPRVRLRGAARCLAARRGMGDLALSVSHEGGYAAAFVVGKERLARFLPRISRTTPRGAYGR